jgi:hypothetical protein
MNTEGFWKYIEDSSRGAESSEEQGENLVSMLVKLNSQEIISFDTHFSDYLHKAYRWDLWAVAYIIHGGCSDDSFEYFRCWLIGKGRAYYEAALANPEMAAKDVTPGDYAEAEDLLYAAMTAYEEVTGDNEMPARTVQRSREPEGKGWDEEKVHLLYPELAKRFDFEGE